MRVEKSLKRKRENFFWKIFEIFDFWPKNTFLDPIFIKMNFFLENRPGEPTKRILWRKSSESALFGEFFSFWYPWTFHWTVRYSICDLPTDIFWYDKEICVILNYDTSLKNFWEMQARQGSIRMSQFVFYKK